METITGKLKALLIREKNREDLNSLHKIVGKFLEDQTDLEDTFLGHTIIGSDSRAIVELRFKLEDKGIVVSIDTADTIRLIYENDIYYVDDINTQIHTIRSSISVSVDRYDCREACRKVQLLSDLLATLKLLTELGVISRNMSVENAMKIS